MTRLFVYRLAAEGAAKILSGRKWLLNWQNLPVRLAVSERLFAGGGNVIAFLAG